MRERLLWAIRGCLGIITFPFMFIGFNLFLRDLRKSGQGQGNENDSR